MIRPARIRAYDGSTVAVSVFQLTRHFALAPVVKTVGTPPMLHPQYAQLLHLPTEKTLFLLQQHGGPHDGPRPIDRAEASAFARWLEKAFDWSCFDPDELNAHVLTDEQCVTIRVVLENPNRAISILDRASDPTVPRPTAPGQKYRAAPPRQPKPLHPMLQMIGPKGSRS